MNRRKFLKTTAGVVLQLNHSLNVDLVNLEFVEGDSC